MTTPFWCLLIGFPAAYVLAKVLKGRSREAVFLLVILPFWSNGLVRIFSWAMVLREGGILDTVLNSILPFRINIDLMYSYPAVIIGLVHSYVPYVVLTCYLSLQAIDDSLIEAFRDDVPDMLHDRPKQGFEEPVGPWLRGPLYSMARELIESDRVFCGPLLSRDGARELLDEHRDGRSDHTSTLWALVALLDWHRRHAPTVTRLAGFPVSTA